MNDDIINTNFELPPKRTYNLYVESLRKMVSEKNPAVTFYKLIVTPDSKEATTFTVVYFKSQMTELLRALGAKEESPGKFTSDKNNFSGKWITAEVAHEADKNGIDRVKLVNVIPYQIKESTTRPEPVSWNEEEGKDGKEEESPL